MVEMLSVVETTTSTTPMCHWNSLTSYICSVAMDDDDHY